MILISQIIKQIENDEMNEENPLTNHFNEMRLEGNGDGFAKTIAKNECEESSEKCCNGEAKDNESEIAGGDTNRTAASSVSKSMSRQIPRRLPLDPKKKNQLLAALKSIEANKHPDQE